MVLILLISNDLLKDIKFDVQFYFYWTIDTFWWFERVSIFSLIWSGRSPPFWNLPWLLPSELKIWGFLDIRDISYLATLLFRKRKPPPRMYTYTINFIIYFNFPIIYLDFSEESLILGFLSFMIIDNFLFTRNFHCSSNFFLVQIDHPKMVHRFQKNHVSEVTALQSRVSGSIPGNLFIYFYYFFSAVKIGPNS